MSSARAEDVRSYSPPPEAKAHFRAGAIAYKNKDFKKAIDEFRASYAIDPAPLLLYNIGQAYRLMGQHEDALFAYKQYVADDPRGEYQREARAKISELEDLLKRQHASQNGPPVGVAERESKETAQTGPPREPAQRETETSPITGRKPQTTDASRPRGAGIAALTLLGLSLACGAAATGLVVHARSIDQTQPTSLRSLDDLIARADAERTAGWSLFGIAGAALVGAAVSFGVWMHRRGHPVISLVPLRDGATVLVGGTL